MKKIITNNSILLTLSILATALSAYLWHYQINPDLTIPCTDQGCSHILSSKHSFIFDVPMSVYGFFFFSFLSVLIFQRFFIKHKVLEIMFSISLIFGFIFSLYLRFLELFIIRAICMWCFLIFVIIIAILLVYLLRNKSEK